MNQSDLPGWALTLKALLEEVEEAQREEEGEKSS